MKKSFNIMLLMVLMLSFTAVSAADFYVDPSQEADLLRAKGAAGAPLPSIQRAADLVQPGDRIILADGDYFEGAVIRTSGTPENKVVVKAANLKQARICNTLTIEGDYVRVEGLYIDGGIRWQGPIPVRPKAAADAAIAGALDLQGTHADLIGMTFADGVYTQATAGSRVANCLFIRNNQNLGTASDCLIENNEFTDMRGDNTDNIRVFGIKVILRHNYIHGTLFENTAESHVDCFQSYDNNKQDSQQILLEGNWCFGDYHQGIMLENDAYNSDYLRDWTLRNNIFCNFAAMAVTAGKGHGIPNVNVVNNIFINAASSSRCCVFNGAAGYGKVWNNIFFYIRSNTMYTENGATMDASNNLLYLSVGAGGGVVAKNTVVADPGMDIASPLLVSMFDGTTRTWSRYFNKDNFPTGLTATSACINAGIDASDITVWADSGKAFGWDLNEVARPQYDAFDIGPFEYDGPYSPVQDKFDLPVNGRVSVVSPVTDRAVFRLEGSAAVGNAFLTIYDQTGRTVALLYDINNQAMVWDGAGAAPGMFFYSLKTGEKVYEGSFTKL